MVDVRQTGASPRVRSAILCWVAVMDLRTVIEKDFPDLLVDRVERLGEGWDHVALRVNDRYVFRLPWHLVEPGSGDADAQGAEAEVRLLRTVQGRLPVAVPEPVFVAADGEYFG